MPPSPPTLRLALLAAPETAGARPVLARARARHAAGRARLSVLLSGEGLAWIGDADLEGVVAAPGAEVLLCSASAREAGLALEEVPPGVRPSSLVAWLRDHRAGDALWSVLP